MKRRNFLKGLMGLIGAVVAPSVVSKVTPKFDDRFICFRELVSKQDLLNQRYIIGKSKNPVNSLSVAKEMMEKFGTVKLPDKKGKFSGGEMGSAGGWSFKFDRDSETGLIKEISACR